MPRPGSAARGLSAAELQQAVAELQSLQGAVVVDAVPVHPATESDDLLLVLQPPGDGAKVFLHLVPGGPRARITTTARRFAKSAMERGPVQDVLHRELASSALVRIWQPGAERRCELTFRGPRGERRLILELFGSRGLWGLLDASGRLLVASRAVETAVRTLRPGDVYAPPPERADSGPEMPSRFAAPVLAGIDEHFTRLDRTSEAEGLRERLLQPTRRELRKTRARADGLARQLADAGRSAALRADADLMLAYAGTVPRGAPEMIVPDPDGGEGRRIILDPALPVVVQAQALYGKARRLDNGRLIAERRHAEAATLVALLTRLEAELTALVLDAPEAEHRLGELRQELEQLSIVPRTERAPPQARQPVERGENFRRFVSAEGYTILVGRDNEQNDRLTMRTANGNDLWLHVGGGRAGSHVVVRLPKQKTASLETLLDAGTLAVHFSKARGEQRIDVVYTQRKHVRKPKGLPPGAVVPSQTKTVTVRLDEARLQRLLNSANGDAGS